MGGELDIVAENYSKERFKQARDRVRELEQQNYKLSNRVSELRADEYERQSDIAASARLRSEVDRLEAEVATLKARNPTSEDTDADEDPNLIVLLDCARVGNLSMAEQFELFKRYRDLVIKAQKAHEMLGKATVDLHYAEIDRREAIAVLEQTIGLAGCEPSVTMEMFQRVIEFIEAEDRPRNRDLVRHGHSKRWYVVDRSDVAGDLGFVVASADSVIALVEGIDKWKHQQMLDSMDLSNPPMNPEPEPTREDLVLKPDPGYTGFSAGPHS